MLVVEVINIAEGREGGGGECGLHKVELCITRLAISCFPVKVLDNSRTPYCLLNAGFCPKFVNINTSQFSVMLLIRMAGVVHMHGRQVFRHVPENLSIEFLHISMGPCCRISKV